MNLFLFNKSLRCYDNTSLIKQLQIEKVVIPIFIFTEQVNKNKNKYFSHNAVQFMIESLIELSNEIKEKYNGKLYMFHHDNLISVLTEIFNLQPIKSIGINFDYSPYACKRQDQITQFCTNNNIKLYMYEDHVLHDILNSNTLNKKNMPYTVFTPYKNNSMQLPINTPKKFADFKFDINNNFKNIKYYISSKDIHKFYTKNNNINVNGGRKNGLQILKNNKQFNEYDKSRDFFYYDTTYLAAYNHFGVISIREVYFAFKNNDSIINQLYWRDFYYNLIYYNQYILFGQISTQLNKPFREKYQQFKWSYNKQLFNKWKTGKLGIPICDAGMRQLNKTGYMHNRARMICANVLTKLLMIPWHWGEKYFAQQLVDYDCIQNACGWGWVCHGIDPQQVFRIFSPQIQAQKYDPNCEYIKKYIPELINIPPKDIINWEITYKNYNTKYIPVINYKIAREHYLNELKKLK